MHGYFKKALRILSSGSAADAFRAAARQLEIIRLNREYRRWLRRNPPPTAEEEAEISRRIEKFDQKPKISILMPVYNTPEKWLRAAIESVLKQLYPNWELCIADDNSKNANVKKILQEYSAADGRIRVVFRETNGHISAASNSALQLARGEFTALMDHDDELSVDALYHVAAEINKFPSADLIYSDEDKIDSRGNRFYPWFKPDWSPELFYSMNLLAHLCVFRTAILRKIGGFREGFEGSQDYDLSLRFIEAVSPRSIRHIPRILYHWRSIPGSVAFDSSEKSYAAERARIAVNEHFVRTGAPARCVAGRSGINRITFDFPAKETVSIIIAVRGSRGEIARNLIKQVPTPNAGIILAGNFDTAAALGDRVKTLRFEDDGLFSILNRAACEASGSVLVFLDESTLTASENWIGELAGRASENGIGAVAPMILNLSGRIIHSGYVFGILGGVGRAYFGRKAATPDAIRRIAAEQNFSAVSAAGMAIRRDLFEKAGGFNAADFPEYYADADLCLRLLQTGNRNIFTPHVRLTQENTRPLPSGPELDALRERWKSIFADDPFYNPNLTASEENYSLDYLPRISRI